MRANGVVKRSAVAFTDAAVSAFGKNTALRLWCDPPSITNTPKLCALRGVCLAGLLRGYELGSR